MPKVPFPITSFQDSNGAPVSFGHVAIHLAQDAKTPDPAQIAASFVAMLNLDANGTVIGTPMVWPSIELTPNTEYVYSVYSQSGQQVVEEEFLLV